MVMNELLDMHMTDSWRRKMSNCVADRRWRCEIWDLDGSGQELLNEEARSVAIEALSLVKGWTAEAVWTKAHLAY